MPYIQENTIFGYYSEVDNNNNSLDNNENNDNDDHPVVNLKMTNEKKSERSKMMKL